jgi:hypothetical protein
LKGRLPKTPFSVSLASWVRGPSLQYYMVLEERLLGFRHGVAGEDGHLPVDVRASQV